MSLATIRVGINSKEALGTGLKFESLGIQGSLQTRIESPDPTNLQAPLNSKDLAPSIPLQTKEADLGGGESSQLEFT